MQLGLYLNMPKLAARERRERLLESGAKIPAGAYYQMLLAEGIPEAQAQGRAAAYAAAAAMQEMDDDPQR